MPWLPSSQRPESQTERGHHGDPPSLPDLKRGQESLNVWKGRKQSLCEVSREKKCFSITVPDGHFLNLFVCFAEIKTGRAHFPNEAIHLLQLPTVKIKVFFIFLHRRGCQHSGRRDLLSGRDNLSAAALAPVPHASYIIDTRI